MIVEAQYNWRGELTSYLREGACVPFDPGNSDFQKIQQALSTGQCEVIEPKLGDIYKAVDRYGEFCGYTTRFGFVPLDQGNHLQALIDEQIADGRCRLKDPHFDPEAQKLEKLVLCTILEQPWPHLRGPYSGELSYTSHELADARSYRFTIKNLPGAGNTKAQLLFADHQIKIEHEFSGASFQFGVLEIEIPIRDLKHLFMGERGMSPPEISPMLNDLLEQHYAQTKRKSNQGPDIAWLINHVGLYVGHFVVEFSNHVIDAFKREYGYQERPMQCLQEGNLDSNPIVIGYQEDGTARLQRFTWIPGANHGLVGEWNPHSLLRYQEETKSPDFIHKTVLARVSEMVRLGFHLEALAPLNAYLEVAIKWALVQCVRNNLDDVVVIKNAGHSRRLAILRLIAMSEPDQYLSDEEFKGQVANARAIYKNRNGYVHEMQLPGISGRRMTLGERRQMEALFHGFLNYWDQNLFLTRLHRIAEGDPIVRRVVENAIRVKTPLKESG